MRKHNKLLIVLFVLVILTRLIPINYSYSEDEMNLPYILEGDKFVDTKYHAHPPLGQILFKLFSLIFGTSLVAIRLFPILTSILNIYLIYLLASFYDKKTALYSLIFSLLSFHLLVTSSLVSIDPLALTAVLIFIYLVQKETAFDKRFTLLTGLFLGLCMLLKYQFIVLYPVLFIYLSLNSKSLWKPLIQMLAISLISIAVFSIFPLASYLTDSPQFSYTLNFIADYGNHDYNQFNMPFGSVFVFMVLWTTLLFITLFVLQSIKSEKDNLLHIIFVAVNIFFYLFAVKRGDYSRYLITLLPSMIILSSVYVAKLNLTKKSLKTMLITSTITLIFSFSLSLFLLPSSIIPLKNFSSYFALLKGLNPNFLFPLLIDHGYWVSINFLILMLTYLAISVFLILYLISSKKLSIFFIAIFLGIGIGHNIYLGSEYLFHVSQPNPDAAIKDMLTYYNQNNLKTPVYTTDKSFLYLLGYGQVLKDGSMRIDEIEELRIRLKENPGTILYLNFASRVSKEDILSLPNCKILRTFHSKGIAMSHVLSCS